MCQVVGVACITLMPWAWARRASTSPSIASSRWASTTRAPVVSGRKSSRTAMSNDSVVTASSRSPAFRPGSVRMLARKLHTAFCGSTTPLGLPVEPEV